MPARDNGGASSGQEGLGGNRGSAAIFSQLGCEPENHPPSHKSLPKANTRFRAGVLATHGLLLLPSFRADLSVVCGVVRVRGLSLSVLVPDWPLLAQL